MAQDDARKDAEEGNKKAAAQAGAAKAQTQQNNGAGHAAAAAGQGSTAIQQRALGRPGRPWQGSFIRLPTPRPQAGDGKIVLLFDLNGVLTEKTPARVEGKYVKRDHIVRPYIEELLRLYPHFRIGAFSSATERTVSTALDVLYAALQRSSAHRGIDGLLLPKKYDLFNLIYWREHCQIDPYWQTRKDGKDHDTIKPLARQGLDLTRTVLVDNDDYKAADGEHENMLHVPHWEQTPVTDRDFPLIIQLILRHLKNVEGDVRPHLRTIERQLRQLRESSSSKIEAAGERTRAHALATATAQNWSGDEGLRLVLAAEEPPAGAAAVDGSNDAGLLSSPQVLQKMRLQALLGLKATSAAEFAAAPLPAQQLVVLLSSHKASAAPAAAAAAASGVPKAEPAAASDPVKLLEAARDAECLDTYQQHRLVLLLGVVWACNLSMPAGAFTLSELQGLMESRGWPVAHTAAAIEAMIRGGVVRVWQPSAQRQQQQQWPWPAAPGTWPTFAAAVPDAAAARPAAAAAAAANQEQPPAWADCLLLLPDPRVKQLMKAVADVTAFLATASREAVAEAVTLLEFHSLLSTSGPEGQKRAQQQRQQMLAKKATQEERNKAIGIASAWSAVIHAAAREAVSAHGVTVQQLLRFVKGLNPALQQELLGESSSGSKRQQQEHLLQQLQQLEAVVKQVPVRIRDKRQKSLLGPPFGVLAALPPELFRQIRAPEAPAAAASAAAQPAAGDAEAPSPLTRFAAGIVPNAEAVGRSIRVLLAGAAATAAAEVQAAVKQAQQDQKEQLLLQQQQRQQAPQVQQHQTELELKPPVTACLSVSPTLNLPLVVVHWLMQQQQEQQQKKEQQAKEQVGESTCAEADAAASTQPTGKRRREGGRGNAGPAAAAAAAAAPAAGPVAAAAAGAGVADAAAAGTSPQQEVTQAAPTAAAAGAAAAGSEPQDSPAKRQRREDGQAPPDTEQGKQQLQGAGDEAAVLHLEALPSSDAGTHAGSPAAAVGAADGGATRAAAPEGLVAAPAAAPISEPVDVDMAGAATNAGPEAAAVSLDGLYAAQEQQKQQQVQEDPSAAAALAAEQVADDRAAAAVELAVVDDALELEAAADVEAQVPSGGPPGAADAAAAVLPAGDMQGMEQEASGDDEDEEQEGEEGADDSDSDEEALDDDDDYDDVRPAAAGGGSDSDDEEDDEDEDGADEDGGGGDGSSGGSCGGARGSNSPAAGGADAGEGEGDESEGGSDDGGDEFEGQLDSEDGSDAWATDDEADGQLQLGITGFGVDADGGVCPADPAAESEDAGAESPETAAAEAAADAAATAAAAATLRSSRPAAAAAAGQQTRGGLPLYGKLKAALLTARQQAATTPGSSSSGSGSLEPHWQPSRLHGELLQFAAAAAPCVAERLYVCKALEQLQAIAAQVWAGSNAAAVMFGSQATGLSLPDSDLDVVLLHVPGCPKPRTTDKGFSVISRKRVTTLLGAFAKALRQAGHTDQKKMQIIPAKVPILKGSLSVNIQPADLVAALGQDNPAAAQQLRAQVAALPHAAQEEPLVIDLQVDISIGIADSAAAVNFLQRQVLALPPMRPLVLAAKALLRELGLNEVFTGGLGSYTLALLVIAHLQTEGLANPAMSSMLDSDHGNPRSLDAVMAHLQQMTSAAAAAAAAAGRPAVAGSGNSGSSSVQQQGERWDLGLLLQGFLLRYGSLFSYPEEAVAVNEGGILKKPQQWFQQKRPFLLSVEDPANPGRDMSSGSHAIKEVKQAFLTAAQHLRDATAEAEAPSSRSSQHSAAPLAAAGVTRQAAVVVAGAALRMTTPVTQQQQEPPRKRRRQIAPAAYEVVEDRAAWAAVQSDGQSQSVTPAAAAAAAAAGGGGGGGVGSSSPHAASSSAACDLHAAEQQLVQSLQGSFSMLGRVIDVIAAVGRGPGADARRSEHARRAALRAQARLVGQRRQQQQQQQQQQVRAPKGQQAKKAAPASQKHALLLLNDRVTAALDRLDSSSQPEQTHPAGPALAEDLRRLLQQEQDLQGSQQQAGPAGSRKVSRKLRAVRRALRTRHQALMQTLKRVRQALIVRGESIADLSNKAIKSLHKAAEQQGGKKAGMKLKQQKQKRAAQDKPQPQQQARQKSAWKHKGKGRGKFGQQKQQQQEQHSGLRFERKLRPRRQSQRLQQQQQQQQQEQQQLQPSGSKRKRDGGASRGGGGKGWSHYD